VEIRRRRPIHGGSHASCVRLVPRDPPGEARQLVVVPRIVAGSGGQRGDVGLQVLEVLEDLERDLVRRRSGAAGTTERHEADTPEFLSGLTLSFRRTVYVTGGLDIGKKAALAGGFKVGDSVRITCIGLKAPWMAMQVVPYTPAGTRR